MKDIEERFGERIEFPLIEDVSMAIGRMFGMIHDASASTAAMRSVFFIDPAGVIRAMIHYPMNIGRSIEELLRVLAAFQEVDARQTSTPEGWRPGAPALLSPPDDQTNADNREARGGPAWYYAYAEDPQ